MCVLPPLREDGALLYPHSCRLDNQCRSLPNITHRDRQHNVIVIKLVGNGFTFKMGDNSILLLRNGAKLEDVDVEGTEVPVKFGFGGGTVENVSIMVGKPETCLLLQGSNNDFKTVTIEQVTCTDFSWNMV